MAASDQMRVKRKMIDNDKSSSESEDVFDSDDTTVDKTFIPSGSSPENSESAENSVSLELRGL